jgi:Small subunit of serine palmitoyltransferase-like
MYYQYEVTFSPYVLTPGEKFVLNTIVVVFITLLLVGIVSYLPKLVAKTAVRILRLYGGTNGTPAVKNNTAMWNDMNTLRMYER